jgi:hypothetical protein
MNKPEHDSEDARISALYRQLPDEQPHADTDAQIRAAARRAVGAGPGKPRLQRLSRLTATAAALLLGVGLTLQWRLHEPEQLRELAMSMPKPAAPEAKSEATADMPAGAMAEAPAEADAPQQNSKPLARQRRDATRSPAAAASSPARERGAAAGDATDGVLADELVASDAAPAAEAPVAPAPLAQAAPDASERDALNEEFARAESGKQAGSEQRTAAERKAARSDRAAAASRFEAAPMLRKQSVAPAPAPAAPPAAPPADYRLLMAEGRHADALASLPASSAPAELVDRDLLQRLSGSRAAPACAALPAAEPREAELLCAYLQLAAEDRPLPPDWLARLQESGAISGAKAYRRAAVLQLFSAPRNAPASPGAN